MLSLVITRTVPLKSILVWKLNILLGTPFSESEKQLKQPRLRKRETFSYENFPFRRRYLPRNIKFTSQHQEYGTRQADIMLNTGSQAACGGDRRQEINQGKR